MTNEKDRNLEKDVFLFAYFKGHGDGLHIAASRNGYEWTALRNDEIFLHPTAGIEKIFRDPCLYLGTDNTFHLVWTSGWNEKGIGYASSKDLLTWSEQQYLRVMEKEEKARNCWAPEIFYYTAAGYYIIYWSTTIEGMFPETQAFGDDSFNHRIYYTTTKDFKVFTETSLLYDGGFNSIDANIVANSDRFLMFVKDETLVPPRKHIRLAEGDTPFRFGPAGTAITSSQYWAEGPTGLKVGNEWVVYFDKYKINDIGAVRSQDLIKWEDISDKICFPKGAQHGYALKVPVALVSALLTDSGIYF